MSTKAYYIINERKYLIMKALTLTLALTLPIIFELDLVITNITIAIFIWVIVTANWLSDNEL